MVCLRVLGLKVVRVCKDCRVDRLPRLQKPWRSSPSHSCQPHLGHARVAPDLRQVGCCNVRPGGRHFRCGLPWPRQRFAVVCRGSLRSSEPSHHCPTGVTDIFVQAVAWDVTSVVWVAGDVIVVLVANGNGRRLGGAFRVKVPKSGAGRGRGERISKKQYQQKQLMRRARVCWNGKSMSSWGEGMQSSCLAALRS